MKTPTRATIDPMALGGHAIAVIHAATGKTLKVFRYSLHPQFGPLPDDSEHQARAWAKSRGIEIIPDSHREP
jgi:hypothetical protein